MLYRHIKKQYTFYKNKRKKYFIELHILRYFLAVMREENISGAAEVLHITQPTLSRQIMDLEKELGIKLFVRGHKTNVNEK